MTMPSNLRDLWLHGSAWLALVLWGWGEWLIVTRSTARGVGAKVVWTIGSVVMLAHFASAFGTRYGWSWTAAESHIRQQTQDVVGVGVGVGIWFNFFLGLIWAAGAVRAWLWPETWERPAGWSRARRAFFWLMWFNGAFVFVSSARRWIGLAVCAWVLLGWYRNRRCGPNEGGLQWSSSP